MRTPQIDGCAPETALTVSGGATPSVTGQWIDLSNSDGNMSLFLFNDGDSTDLSVTYEYGVVRAQDRASGDVTNVTPEGGGTIANMTNVDLNNSNLHEAITVDPTKRIRFTTTNGAGANTATVELIIVIQESQR